MRRFWIVLFVIALLPLRGWAVAMGATESPASVDPAHEATQPCPMHAAMGHAHGSGADLTADAADDASASVALAHVCASCDLCHAPLAIVAGEPAHGAPPCAAQAPAGAGRDTGRLMAASLERPPRR